MRAGRYETGSEGKFTSRWRAKSPDALCAVLPKIKTGGHVNEHHIRDKSALQVLWNK